MFMWGSVVEIIGIAVVKTIVAIVRDLEGR